MRATDLSIALGPLSDLLAAFNHRHRNQHRRSAWWCHFNFLRRAVRRILHVSSGPKTKSRKPVTADALSRYARWEAEHVIPPAYLAFTQLAADNQFAPLGLFLLGALARFNAAISPLLPPPDSPAIADHPREVPNKTSVPVSASAVDLGESVSRDDFPVSAVPQGQQVKERAPSEPESATPTQTKPFEPAAETEAKDRVKKKKKRKAAAGTDLSDIFGSLA